MNRFAASIAWLLASCIALAGCSRSETPNVDPSVAQGKKTDAADKGGKKKSATDEPGKTPSPIAKRPDAPPAWKSKAKSNEEVRKICELLASDPEKKEREDALNRLEKLHPELFPHVVALMIEKPGTAAHFNALSFGGLGPKAADALPLVMKEWERIEKLCSKYGKGIQGVQYGDGTGLNLPGALQHVAMKMWHIARHAVT